MPAQPTTAEAAQFRNQELSGQGLTGPPPHSQADPPTAGSEAEGFLGGVDHVEEAVLVFLLLVDVRDGRGHAHHAVLVHQQEEGLRGVQLQAAPEAGGRVCSCKGLGCGADVALTPRMIPSLSHPSSPHLSRLTQHRLQPRP